MQHWWEAKLVDHMEEEKKVTPELRNAVFRRDGWQCQRCGEDNLDALTVHHVLYRSQGGKHKVDNLVTLCGTHHMDIHARRLYLKRINGRWYFASVRKKEVRYDPEKQLTLATVRLRRHLGWDST